MLLAHLEYRLDNSILTQRTLQLRIGADDVSQTIDRIATKLARKSQVAGFRKGHAPPHVVRREMKDRIAAEAFQELKQSALEQVMKHLEDADRPLIPPEVLDPGKVRVRYGQLLEFSVKYLIDPSGITRNPAQPDFQQGAVQPGSAVQQQTTPPGIPTGPNLPTAK